MDAKDAIAWTSCAVAATPPRSGPAAKPTSAAWPVVPLVYWKLKPFKISLPWFGAPIAVFVRSIAAMPSRASE